ncbi:MAG: hypothetical protein GY749_07525 [Desulfobacteraceae bacterium]|nr:hypothetical protein [Desulfobacteraceae bacterium]
MNRSDKASSDLSLFFEDMMDEDSDYLNKEERDKLNREYPTRFVTEQDETEQIKNGGISPDEFIEDEDDEINYAVDVDKEDVCCEKNCLGNVTEQEISDRRYSFAEMNKREQDIFILSQLAVFKISGKKRYKARGGHEKQRTRFKYRFDTDLSLCRKAFLYVYGIHL